MCVRVLVQVCAPRTVPFLLGLNVCVLVRCVCVCVCSFRIGVHEAVCIILCYSLTCAVCAFKILFKLLSA